MRTAQKTTWCSGPMTPQTPGCDPWSIIVNAPAAEAKMPPVWLLELCAFRGRRSSATWTHRRNASRAANSKKPERAGKRGICGGGCARRLRGGPRVRAGGQRMVQRGDQRQYLVRCAIQGVEFHVVWPAPLSGCTASLRREWTRGCMRSAMTQPTHPAKHSAKHPIDDLLMFCAAVGPNSEHYSDSWDEDEDEENNPADAANQCLFVPSTQETAAFGSAGGPTRSATQTAGRTRRTYRQFWWRRGKRSSRRSCCSASPTAPAPRGGSSARSRSRNQSKSSRQRCPRQRQRSHTLPDAVSSMVHSVAGGMEVYMLYRHLINLAGRRGSCVHITAARCMIVTRGGLLERLCESSRRPHEPPQARGMR